MRFFEKGPIIPDELLVAGDDARVVLFCGAGVSKAYAGLPTFMELADRVLNALGSRSDSEERRVLTAMQRLDIEGLSGAISADRIFSVLEKSFAPQQIGKEVAKALRTSGKPDLRAHKVLLDLATQRSGHVRLITTNFDRLPQEQLAEISLSASRWFALGGMKVWERSPDTFERLWTSFIETITADANAGKSAIIRNKADTDIDWVTEAINSSAGNLAQLLMEFVSGGEWSQGEGLPSDWRKRAKDLLSLPGESRRFVLTILARNLSWFFYVDANWATQTMLSVLEAAEGGDDRDAIWGGFFWGARLSQRDLYLRMKPLLLEMARTRAARRRRHGEVLAGILLAGWGAHGDGEERYVSNEELHGVLLEADDSFRGHVLWHLNRWSEHESWSNQLDTFLRVVWPKHLKARTPAISARLADLAIRQKRQFPEVVAAVVPLLGRADANSLTIYRLKSDEGAIMREHPSATLDLLYAMLPEDSNQWPWGAHELVRELAKAAPSLLDNSKLIELLGRLDA